MRRARIVLWCVATVIAGALNAGEGYLVRENPESVRFRLEIRVAGKKPFPSVVTAVLPYAESNSYQEVVRDGTPTGELATVRETGGGYLRAKYGPKDFGASGEVVFRDEFVATLYDVRIDFSRIRASEPYRKDQAYRYYTGRDGDHIDPENADIARIARTLGMEAKDPIDYTRLAYRHIMKTYRHKNDSRFRPLAEVIASSEGQSAELCSVYISLLRARGIPARHAMGFLYNGASHVIAEFFVEGYGWIPVDVTFQLLEPDKDYFGNIPRERFPVVVSRGINLTVEGPAGSGKIGKLLAGVCWWKPSRADINAAFRVDVENAF